MRSGVQKLPIFKSKTFNHYAKNFKLPVTSDQLFEKQHIIVECTYGPRTNIIVWSSTQTQLFTGVSIQIVCHGVQGTKNKQKKTVSVILPQHRGLDVSILLKNQWYMR